MPIRLSVSPMREPTVIPSTDDFISDLRRFVEERGMFMQDLSVSLNDVHVTPAGGAERTVSVSFQVLIPPIPDEAKKKKKVILPPKPQIKKKTRFDLIKDSSDE